MSVIRHSESMSDPLDDTILTTIPVGSAPSDIALVPTGPLSGVIDRLYVSNSGDDTVTAIDYPEPPLDLIKVPVRWCVVEGTQTAGANSEGMGGQDPGTTIDGTGLVQRLQEVNQIWVPTAHIAFTSPPLPSGVPVIADPTTALEAGSSAYRRGDVNDRSLWRVDAACEVAWQNLYPEAKGLTVTNLRQYFLSLAGHSGAIGGTPQPDPSLWVSDRLCRQPHSLQPADVYPREFVTVMDPGLYSIFGYGDPANTLAHELGHALLLGHGNGLDDDKNGLSPSGDGFSLNDNPGIRRYDQYCDPAGVRTDSNGAEVPIEDQAGTSLMSELGRSRAISPLQIEQARAAAKLVPGRETSDPDPAGGIAIPPPCNDLPCGIPEELLLFYVSMSEAPATAVTNFTHTALAIGDQTDVRYVIFADLDDNASTGCAPASLGYPTSFAGAELVTEVRLMPVTGGQQTIAHVWRCEGGTLMEVNDSRVSAAVTRQTILSVPGFAVVSISMPDAVRGPSGDTVRVQALAQQLGAGAQLRRVPAADDGGETISLAAPELPDCTISPVGVVPGATVTLDASHLPANEAFVVDFGLAQVGAGTTSATGTTQIDVTVPATATGGSHGLTVRSTTTVASAICAVYVDGPSRCESVVCTALDQCHRPGICDPSTGECTNPTKVDGFACNDGNPCTQLDACQAGVCRGSATGADTDADGYCDFQETQAGCSPTDFAEIPPQPVSFAGLPSESNVGANGLLTYAAPANLTRTRVSVSTEPSCATAGHCGATHFCTAGRLSDPCTKDADCDQPANQCRVIVNYGKVVDLALISASAKGKIRYPGSPP